MGDITVSSEGNINYYCYYDQLLLMSSRNFSLCSGYPVFSEGRGGVLPDPPSKEFHYVFLSIRTTFGK